MTALRALTFLACVVTTSGDPPPDLTPDPAEDTSVHIANDDIAPPAAPYTVWDRLAMCESSQNWAANTGNGYFGGLQFDRQTWLAYGGGRYASRADLASRSQQIAIAERLHAARGFQPWPYCSRHLGLR